VTHEGALHLDDVLVRRTRASIETPDRGEQAAPVVADLVAEHLGWDPETIAAEVAVYGAQVRAERSAQEAPDDAAAIAARAVADQTCSDTSTATVSSSSALKT
jgi:glycerol-3-phosphate dehydrogenase